MSEEKQVLHCLPGEDSLDDSWFERLNAFEQQETKRQVAFKRRQWPGCRALASRKQPRAKNSVVIVQGD